MHAPRVRATPIRCVTDGDSARGRAVGPPPGTGTVSVSDVARAAIDIGTNSFHLVVARLQPGHPLFELATKHLHQKPAELWGRRTLFYYAQKPLLVNEIFLPDIAAV